MAKKNNIRSMRFSDEILEMIESQAGDTFTAKFEALVTRYMWELPQKERELAEINQKIAAQRKELERIKKRAMALDDNMYRMESMFRNYSSIIKGCINSLEATNKEP